MGASALNETATAVEEPHFPLPGEVEVRPVLKVLRHSLGALAGG